MTSSASSPTWLPAAVARAAIVPPYPYSFPLRTTGGRHSAPEFAAVLEAVATELDLSRRGRHAEPEWSRQVFDPVRDEGDVFEWLGFIAGE
jgi:hypothetical protein